MQGEVAARLLRDAVRRSVLDTGAARRGSCSRFEGIPQAIAELGRPARRFQPLYPELLACTACPTSIQRRLERTYWRVSVTEPSIRETAGVLGTNTVILLVAH